MESSKDKKKPLKTLSQIKKMNFENRLKYFDENHNELIDRDHKEYTNYLLSHYNAEIYEGDQKKIELIKKSRLGWKENLRYAFELNHMKILSAINEELKYGMMPTVTEIADKTELSRTTIYKHLKHFDISKYRTIEDKKFKLMRDCILSNLFFEATRNRDIKAASLYLKFTQNPSERVISKTQNNYIQINNLTLSEELLNGLPEDRLIEIEEIIKESIPELLEEKVDKG